MFRRFSAPLLILFLFLGLPLLANADDTTPPVITLNGDADMTVNFGDTFVDPGATAFDDVDGDITANIVVGGDTVDTSTLGDYIITYDVSDSSDNPADEVTRTVHVVDNVPPVITLNGDADMTVNFGDTFTDPGATASDNVDGDISGNIIVGGDTVDTSTLGDYTITYDVSDSSGNQADEVTRTVHVVDNVPPVITLNGDADMTVNLGDTFTDPGATASDNVDGDITGSIVVGGDIVDTSTPGNYVITYDVSDNQGNPADEVTRTVHVVPVPPVITLNGDSDVTVNLGGTFTDPGATAEDNVDGDITADIVVGGDTVNTSVAGDYVITYNVSDSLGSSADEVTRTVHVVADTTPPVITLIGGDVTILAGTAYIDAGATALDNVDGDITANIVVGGDTINTSTPGDYVITYDVSDNAGNPADEVTRTVHVLDPHFIIVGRDPYTSILVGKKLYINNQTDGTVSVIDTTTNTVIKTITVGSDSNFYSTLVGTKIYVNNSDDNSVSVIDTNTDNVVDTITVGAGPFFSTAIGTKLYVTNSGDNTVSVIDTNTDTVIGDPIPVGSRPQASILVGTKLYVSNTGDNTVSVIDTNTDDVSSITVGNSPQSNTRVGSKLYVNNQNDGTVSVIDTTTDTVIGDPIVVGSTNQFSTLVGTKLYVSNTSDNTVSVIDTNTDTVIGDPIAVGAGPIYAFLLGTKLYVITRGDNALSVIDTNTDTVIGDPIVVGTQPQYSILVGTNLYVPNNNSDTVSVINTLTDTLLLPAAPVLTSFTSSSSNGNYSANQNINITANFGKTLKAGSTMTITLNTGATVTLNSVSGSTLSGTYTVGAGDSAPDLTVSSIVRASVSDTSGDTGTSYDVPASPQLTGDANGNIGDTSNISVGQTYCNIAVGTNPYQLTMVGSIAYVTNEGSNTVSVIDTSTNDVIATISVGTQPYGVAYNSGSKEIYVANIASNTISVIDADPTSGTYNTVTHTISVGVRPFYVATLGSNIYVTNNLSNTVSVIAVGSHTVTHTISVGNAPLGIKALGTNLYVVNSGAGYGGSNGGSVSVINSVNNTVTDNIIVGAGSRGIAVLGTEAYVANFADNTVSVIDTNSDTVTNTISVGSGPRGLLALGTNIYVENWNDGTISVIDTLNHTVTAAVKVGNTPAGMTALGTDIYFSRFTDGVVSALDTTNNTLTSVGSNDCPTVAEQTPSNNQTQNTVVFHPGGSSGSSGATSYTLPAVSPAPNVTSVTTSTTVTAPATSSFSRPLSVGAIGADVKALQVFLNAHGFIIAASGAGSAGNETTTFGVLTSKALEAFQKAYNIPATGTLGPLTTAAINAISGNPSLASSTITTPTTGTASFSRSLTAGSTGTDVKSLQAFLNSQGFTVASSGAGSPGNETDTFGPLTVKALAAFQKAHNITPAVGYFGPKTMAVIEKIQ